MYTQHGNIIHLAWQCTHSMAILYTQHDNVHTAWQYYTLGMAMYTQHGNIIHLAWQCTHIMAILYTWQCTHSMAILYTRHGNVHTAWQYYTLGMAMYTQHGTVTVACYTLCDNSAHSTAWQCYSHMLHPEWQVYTA